MVLTRDEVTINLLLPLIEIKLSIIIESLKY